MTHGDEAPQDRPRYVLLRGGRDADFGLAADRYEIETLERALATVQGDAYYQALSGKYLDDVDDRDIAEALECDTSTVWRHRKRLVQRVAVWLYGAEALR